MAEAGALLLADLRSEAEAAERTKPAGEKQPGAGPGAAPHAEPPPPGGAAEWREVLDFLADELAEHYPKLRAVYTPEKLDRLAQRIAPVAERYGWNSAWKFLERWAPEFFLLITVAPLARTTIRVIREQKTEEAKAGANQPSAQPGGGDPPAEPVRRRESADGALKPNS